MRIVDPAHIPEHLWDPLHPPTTTCAKSGCLKLPKDFSSAYNDLLVELGILQRALEHESNTEGGAVGGDFDGAFEEHFARRFSGSAARVQLCALDPRNTFSTTSDAIFTLFAGGSVRILDVPFGAGAASALLLSIVAELRNHNVLPRHAAKITVIGGDIDNKALRAGSKLFGALHKYWLRSGLNVSLKAVEWDAASDESTFDLVEIWQDGHRAHERCATVVANFSGFLCEFDGATNRRRFEALDFAIRNLLLASAKFGGPFFWIEPKEKHVPAMFAWLQDKIVAKYKRIKPGYLGSRHDLSTTRSTLDDAKFFTARALAAFWETSAK